MRDDLEDRLRTPRNLYLNRDLEEWDSRYEKSENPQKKPEVSYEPVTDELHELKQKFLSS